MQRIKLSDEAEQDLMTSFHWYEAQKAGLGERFLGIIEESLLAIIKIPKAFQLVYGRRVRSYPVRDFPFNILYIAKLSQIEVIAIFHSHRNPRIWKKRAR